jgi:MFS family permease
MTIRFLMFDAVATVLYLAVGSLGWPMYFVRVLHGAIDGTARVALFAFVYDILPAGRQGEAMATFSLCGMIPAALAPMAGEELIRRGGFGAFFAVACGLCVVAAYAARRFPDDRPARGPGAAIVSEGPGYPALLADRALLPFWIATLLFALAISSRTSFVAPFAYERGIERVGWYFAIYSSVGAALRVVSGRSIDRIGLERMLAPSFAVLALGLAAIAFTGYSGMLNLAALIGGIGHGYVYPVLSALVIARTQPNAIGRSSSIYASLYDLGGFAGPYLLGAIASGAGYGPMFAVSGALALGAAAYLVSVERLGRRLG